jgi:AraC-like DNA-binding protein
MLEQGRHPVDVIARQTGFADRDRMRRAFLRAFGQPPQVIRRNARAEVRTELRAIARNANGPQFGGSPLGQR